MSCQPFSVFRLTHEAFRKEFDKLTELMNSPAVNYHEIKSTFFGLSEAIEFHSRQEDFAFYPELEKKGIDVTAQFTKDHEQDHELVDQIKKQYEKPPQSNTAIELATTMAAVARWSKNHLEHLEREESILMPLLKENFDYAEAVTAVSAILNYDLKKYTEDQATWVFSRLNESQKDVYKAMVKHCLPDVDTDSVVREIAA